MTTAADLRAQLEKAEAEERAKRPLTLAELREALKKAEAEELARQPRRHPLFENTAQIHTFVLALEERIEKLEAAQAAPPPDSTLAAHPPRGD